MLLRVIPVLLILSLVSGCVTSGGHGPFLHGSQVELSEANFTVTDQGVVGEAEVYVLNNPFAAMASLYFSMIMQGASLGAPGSVAGLPFGDAELLTRAAEDVKTKAGIGVGSKKHLVNMTHDYKVTWWVPFLISTQSIKLTADAIEFN